MKNHACLPHLAEVQVDRLWVAPTPQYAGFYATQWTDRVWDARSADPGSMALLLADIREMASRATNAGSGPEWFQWLNTQLSHGRPLFLFCYLAMIVFFAFFYTAVQFNSEETSDNLKRHGGFIPGIRPGKATEQYFDYLLNRITVIGAAYLALICLIPEIAFSQAGVPFYLGGTSLLIVVNVTMDTVSQIQSHLIAHQYGDLIKKAKLKGGRRR